MLSAGAQAVRFTVLSRKNGNLNDYDHINMLTHPCAVKDQFPLVLEWLRQHATEQHEATRSA